MVLGILAALVWVSVLNQTDRNAGGCQAGAMTSSVPAAPVTPGDHLPTSGLDTVAPAPPQQVAVQVLNANGQRGEAAVVAAGLADLGFMPTAEPTNDPLHPAFDLECPGEIRFGVAGQAAARTLSLAVPCAELVRDSRPGAGIDLALGTKFTKLRPNSAAHDALQQLVRLGPPPRGDQTTRGLSPPVDPDLLREARQVDC